MVAMARDPENIGPALRVSDRAEPAAAPRCLPLATSTGQAIPDHDGTDCGWMPRCPLLLLSTPASFCGEGDLGAEMTKRYGDPSHHFLPVTQRCLTEEPCSWIPGAVFRINKPAEVRIP